MISQVESELFSLLAPERTLLLVVDVQNDFCHDEGVLGRAGVPLGAIQAAAETLLQFTEVARRARVPIVFIKTHHDPSNNSPAWLSKMRGRAACTTGSWGADFYRLRPTDADAVVVKHRYSGFVGTNLEVILRSLGRPTLLLTGITTNVCVESTARDAFMRDYHVFLVEDCAAAPTKEEHQSTVYNIRTYFGYVLDSSTVAAFWGEAKAP